MTLEPLLNASPVIQIHAYSAIAAFVLGGYVLFRPKGNNSHKMMGKVWVILMLITAGSSLFIWSIRMVGLFSPIHLLSLLTFAGLYEAVQQARKGNIKAHRKNMQQLYLLALLIAGVFTFAPGRIMYEVVFDTDGASTMEWAVFAGVVGGLFIAGYLMLRRKLAWRLPFQRGNA